MAEIEAGRDSGKKASNTAGMSFTTVGFCALHMGVGKDCCSSGVDLSLPVTGIAPFSCRGVNSGYRQHDIQE